MIWKLPDAQPLSGEEFIELSQLRHRVKSRLSDLGVVIGGGSGSNFNIDGGRACEIFPNLQQVEGGRACESYSSNQIIDAGVACP